MTKEDYYKAKEARVKKMTLEHLQKEYISLDARAFEYFKNWQDCDRKIKELEIKVFSLLKS